jgi:hypothetical protein
MQDIDEMIKEEWRNLGFYYDIDENANPPEWKIYGSKDGLLNLIKLLEDYTANKVNDSISEHEHYGPYHYFKIMTWDEPEIAESYIAGSIDDLISLKVIITDKLNETDAGQTFTIGSEYGTNNTAVMKFFVMNDNFDPVSMDGNYNK